MPSVRVAPGVISVPKTIGGAPSTRSSSDVTPADCSSSRMYAAARSMSCVSRARFGNVSSSANSRTMRGPLASR